MSELIYELKKWEIFVDTEVKNINWRTNATSLDIIKYIGVLS